MGKYIKEVVRGDDTYIVDLDVIWIEWRDGDGYNTPLMASRIEYECERMVKNGKDVHYKEWDKYGDVIEEAFDNILMI